MDIGLETLRNPEHFEEIFHRVQTASGARTQVELAARLGIRQSSVSDAKKNRRVPASWVLSLALDGWNPRWLVAGEPPRSLTGADEADAEGVAESTTGYGGVSMITVHSQDGEMGAEGRWTAPELGRVGVPANLARQDVLAVRMQDSGMAPTVRRGALVGVDLARRGVQEGDVYAVAIPGMGMVLRRVFLDLSEDALILKGEDAAAPGDRLPLAQKSDRLIGRVAWVVQEL
ncbi:S24 family peptidase [Desulfohalovibrio reitneri]|uniref:S24 family peptidase n=1 Tax=Desulfohalovibrio reitneri TaxID=1307759 RepID=UPI00068B2DE0|nr:S24 family peptidase [Desulfohalovibrio reitneri]